MPQVISGINAVKENLRKGEGIVELFIAKGKKIERLQEILDTATQKKIPIRFKDRLYLDKISSSSSHQGVIAILNTYHYLYLDDLIERAISNTSKGLLIAADHITDTGNLGSLIRTAEFFGVQGLILPKDRSASITDAVHKRSAGGSAYLPVTKVVNLARALRQLADENFWVVGAAGESSTNIYEFDWNRDLVLVMGNESKGLSRVVKDQCHHLVSIPRFGKLASLNVSVAAGIILSEIVRQRDNSCRNLSGKP
ncbi:MAG: 23S rRNA (guanosine(2251)-2'-O)-methyltransferase RlmB [Deltaproteobacteria bacterium]|nr:23S rRNA (guanosine(2251)-2'-O)-methyltransferase RlmB [Deltaproteobacteria bacterium]